MPVSLEEKIRKSMVAGISEFQMIQPNDKILVAVSGGKDSTTMLLMLKEIQRRAPFHFDFQAVILDQKQPNFDLTSFKNWLENIHDISLQVLQEDTYSIVIEKTEPGKSYCGLCSRMRRGILYTYAFNNAFTKIALGHHRDDLNETVLLNMFYGGKIATMPPVFRSSDNRNTVIRPMIYVLENDISAFSKNLQFPIIPCNLCGNQEGLKRLKLKNILRELEKDYDQLGTSIARSLSNVQTERLLDARHFKNESLAFDDHHVDL